MLRGTLHPGHIQTELGRYLSILHYVVLVFLKIPKSSAQTTVMPGMYDKKTKKNRTFIFTNSAFSR